MASKFSVPVYVPGNNCAGSPASESTQLSVIPPGLVAPVDHTLNPGPLAGGHCAPGVPGFAGRTGEDCAASVAVQAVAAFPFIAANTSLEGMLLLPLASAAEADESHA